ncbi:MAG: tetratricopeptide repeat protein [Deltaproteobacteria bacterium]|nr:tetratricopeptide repeat protein [Deltaproteobacteria bacterium]
MNRKIILLVAGVIVLSLIMGYMFGAKTKKPSIIKIDKKTASSEGAANSHIDYNEVIGEIQGHLKTNPNDAKALAALGDTYFELQRFEDAVDVYKKAIAIDPDDIDSCNDLGLCLHYTGRTQEAIKYIDDCIKRNPNYQRIYLSKGFILSVRGKLPEARQSWEIAYKMAPDSDVGKAAEEFLLKNR